MIPQVWLSRQLKGCIITFFFNFMLFFSFFFSTTGEKEDKSEFLEGRSHENKLHVYGEASIQKCHCV